MEAEIIARDLSDVDIGEDLSCDVLIVGGGPAGLSIARGLEDSGLDVLIAESGGIPGTALAEDLNRVSVDESNWTDEQIAKRVAFHSPQAENWKHEWQSYGVRCRAIGGSTSAWAGKSAAFVEHDFAARAWVPNSGWPIELSALTPYLAQAAESLNLSSNCNDERLWALMGRNPPKVRPDPGMLSSFFWQFARSKISPMEIMHVGKEFLNSPPKSCRILTRATGVRILTDPSASHAIGMCLADANGARRHVSAGAVVLAASAIENARLLLVSGENPNAGLGNEHGTVGRYLMDHPSATLGRMEAAGVAHMAALFGFYALKYKRGVSMFMHGLSPAAAVQEQEGLLNCGIYFQGERAADNPWDAMRQLIRRRSRNYAADLKSVVASPGILVKGFGRYALQRNYFPERVSHFVVDQAVRFWPNMAVEEFQTQGIPHKLTGLKIQAACEQVPDKNNRVTLSDNLDRLGVPVPKVTWRVGMQEAHTLSRVAKLIDREFGKAGLPRPVLEDWVETPDPERIPFIDMAHSCGTTRMSSDPKKGVVDENCQVHGIGGLFVAGASVFPTSGHANPTLMIMSLAYRLADHLRARGRQTGKVPFLHEGR